MNSEAQGSYPTTNYHKLGSVLVYTTEMDYTVGSL